MDSGHSFDDEICEWIECVNEAVKKELIENTEDFRHRFEKINSALNFHFDSIFLSCI